jgi:hypothetical protein
MHYKLRRFENYREAEIWMNDMADYGLEVISIKIDAECCYHILMGCRHECLLDNPD